MANQIWTGAVSGNLATSGNWSPSSPTAGDNVRFPAGSPAIDSGLTALNTSTLSGALATVIFEDGYSSNVGTSTSPMQFTCTRFEGFFAGGQQFIDLEASNISIKVKGSPAVSVGDSGTHIKGSNLVTVDVEGGSIAIGRISFQTATFTAIRVYGQDSDVYVGEGVTATTVEVMAGALDFRCAATTITVNGGTLTTNGTGAITTMNVNAGAAYPNSTGTITTLNAYGGTTDFTKCGAARTVSTLKQNPNSTFTYDPATLTISAQSAPDYPSQRTYARTA